MQNWYNMNLNEAVAIRINELLNKKNMTRYRLEQNSGILHGSMDQILQSKNKTVTLTTVYRLARGFDMTVLEFLDADIFRNEEIEID